MMTLEDIQRPQGSNIFFVFDYPKWKEKLANLKMSQ